MLIFSFITHSFSGSFPARVWERIAIHLGPEAKSISLLCSSLRESGQRALFRDVKFTGLPFDGQVTKKQKKIWLNRTAKFRELAASPFVKTYISSVELVEWTSGHPEPLVSFYAPFTRRSDS
jgi:hypothetical protein